MAVSSVVAVTFKLKVFWQRIPALTFTDTPDALSTDQGQYYVNLGTIVDINLGLEYRYTPRVSIFLQANNLAAQRYNRWYSYPVQPIQVIGGITARFSARDGRARKWSSSPKITSPGTSAASGCAT